MTKAEQNNNKGIQILQPEIQNTEFSPLEMLDRAEIDTQIKTAKNYPRSIESFQKTAISMATMNEEVAASCGYALPRAGKVIEGPGVRLAEIVGASYGNMRYASRIVREEGKFIVAQGVAHDLERNIAASVEVRRRITDKYGKRYNDDMITTTANAACSIALRNAIFKVVPKVFVDPIYQAAKKVAVGTEKTLNVRRTAAIEYFKKQGVSRDRLLEKLGKEGVNDIDLKDLETLTGIRTAIQEETTTIEEMFPEPKKEPAKKQTEGKKITDKQHKRLMALSKAEGVKHEELKAYIKKEHGYNSTKDISSDHYTAICDWVLVQNEPKTKFDENGQGGMC